MECFIFYVQLLFIVLVSVIDIFYTLETQDTLLLLEQNPTALWIIQTYGVNKFISLKTSTTCLVVLIIQWSYYNTSDKNKKSMWIVLSGVTVFQFWLFLWLTTSNTTWIRIKEFLGLI